MTTKYSSSCGEEPPGAAGLHVYCGCADGGPVTKLLQLLRPRRREPQTSDTGLHTAALWFCFDLKVSVPWCFPLEYEDIDLAFDIFFFLQEPTVERLSTFKEMLDF